MRNLENRIVRFEQQPLEQLRVLLVILDEQHLDSLVCHRSGFSYSFGRLDHGKPEILDPFTTRMKSGSSTGLAIYEFAFRLYACTISSRFWRTGENHRRDASQPGSLLIAASTSSPCMSGRFRSSSTKSGRAASSNSASRRKNPVRRARFPPHSGGVARKSPGMPPSSGGRLRDYLLPGGFPPSGRVQNQAFCWDLSVVENRRAIGKHLLIIQAHPHSLAALFQATADGRFHQPLESSIPSLQGRSPTKQDRHLVANPYP